MSGQQQGTVAELVPQVAAGHGGVVGPLGEGGPGDTTIILANFADRTHEAYTIGLPHGGHWRVRFNSDWAGYDEEFGNFESVDCEAETGIYHDQPFHGTFGLAPYSVLILSQEPV